MSRNPNRSLIPIADRGLKPSRFSRLWQAVFGCRHSRTTFPITRDNRTYVACLKCGKEFTYSWTEMRRMA